VPSVPVGAIGLTLAVLLLAPVDDPAYDLSLALVMFPILIVFAARASYSGLAARMCLTLGPGNSGCVVSLRTPPRRRQPHGYTAGR